MAKKTNATYRENDYLFNGIPVSTVIDINNKEESVNFYAKQMYQKTNSMFEWTGLPETIPKYILELFLQVNGYVVITHVSENEIKNNKNKYPAGLYAFTNVGLGGEPDPYFRPTIATIANPALGLSVMREIGVDCVVVRNDVLLQGFNYINSRYATMLTENDITFRLYDINTRITSLISASNDTIAESAKRYLKDIENGVLGIASDSALIESLKTAPYATQTDKFTGLIEYHQYLKASWLNDLGLNANYNMKRETLNSAETGVNESALLPYIDTMLKCREEDIEKVNKMFGTNITVNLASSWADIQEEIDQSIEDMDQEETTNDTPNDSTEENEETGVTDNGNS